MKNDAVLHPSRSNLAGFRPGQAGRQAGRARSTSIWKNVPNASNVVSSMSSDSFLIRLRNARVSKFLRPPCVGTGTRRPTQGETIIPKVQFDTLPPGSGRPSRLPDPPRTGPRRDGRGLPGPKQADGPNEVLKVVGRHMIERRRPRSVPPRDPRRRPTACTPTSCTRLLRIPLRREHRLRHGIRRGLDLAQLVKAKGPLPVAHACNFVYQAALGLQHAHEQGMVHRDIKPGNLMLSREGDKADRQGARLRPGQGDQREPGRRWPDPRGPDARHARLHRPRADPRRPDGRHPGRHLQPWLHPLLPPDRRPAVPGPRASTTCSRPTTRWTPSR